MKYYFYVLVLACIGCTTVQPIKSAQSTQLITSHSISSLEQHSKTKTTILYYYVSPDTKAQRITEIHGTFHWENECIYLFNKSGDRLVKLTALFPELPKNSVSWNEEQKIITLMNPYPTPQYFDFKMGDVIISNGYYHNTNPEFIASRDEKEKKCISDEGLVFVGTYDIQKR
ncbi:hypothetical protein [Moraxella oblonga]|uniref:hypothetical protein n=1 Tax=Moraxella oblonga TaxID=200413 RepID=UPI0008345D3A|nr:hypothetical protein [Moraxella oblonga]